MAEKQGEINTNFSLKISISLLPKRGRGRSKKLKILNIKTVDQQKVQIVKTLIIQLNIAKSMIDQSTITGLKNTEFKILLMKCLLNVNALDSETYVFFIQLDVIRLASYTAAISNEYHFK